VAPVDGLDLSHVSVTAGELNGKELAATLEFERVLHGVACVSIEASYELPEGTLLKVLQRTGGEDLAAVRAAVAEAVRGRRRRQTLIFCKSVKQAERVSEIVNRWLPDAARWVSGDQQRFPRELRRNLFRDFGKGRFGFLSNVGVCTEGTDIPGVEVVVVARPTLSRALYEQMVGRGTRPHESIAHSLNRCADAAGRRAMIAMSPKPSLTVVDMAGNAGRHKLVMLTDLLGGDYSDDVRERAKKKAAKLSAAGVPADVAQLLPGRRGSQRQAAPAGRAGGGRAAASGSGSSRRRTTARARSTRSACTASSSRATAPGTSSSRRRPRWSTCSAGTASTPASTARATRGG
jgi:superfamily II DNA or RNA helicase